MTSLEDSIADKTTLVTVSGERSLLTRILPGLSTNLPTESVEWKRSYGRAPKTVNIRATFIDFDPDILAPLNGQVLKTLRGVPIFHTLWIECPDLDAYRSYAKDQIIAWLAQLRKCGINNDWLVIVIEGTDVKKTNKLLPRSSVIDKLKTDTGVKQPDRYASLLDPSKNDSRASESWQNLLHRLRLLILEAYNRVLSRFEENMRNQRERRNEPGWNFCEYFLLQEELAFTYEMLGIYDEALVQYDELDALFTQFILNSNVTDGPDWLKVFTRDASNWSGLSLNPIVNRKLRETIRDQSASLLDLRNYLFARQCAMLLKVHMPWEMAKRSLTFLHNCVQEISILEISYPYGGVSSWVFLSCLEVLLTCEKYSDSSNKIQYYCLFTASLWAYAREKLYELGEMCGLLPTMTPSSEHLHRVVELSSGIRDQDDWSDNDHSSVKSGRSSTSLVTKQESPVQKLKEALSSKEAFQTYYLELSELAISTYKHIGRIRSARCIGIDLAKFYFQLDQIPQAVTFLQDAQKTFQLEGWRRLELETLVDIAECFKKLGDNEKLIRTLVQIASFEEVKTEEKWSRLQEALDVASSMENPVVTVGDDLIQLNNCQLADPGTKIIPESKVSLELEVENHLPHALQDCHVEVALSFSADAKTKIDPQVSVEKKTSSRSGSSGAAGRGSLRRMGSSASGESSSASSSFDRQSSLDHTCTEDGNQLSISEKLDFRQDRTLASARLVCRNSSQVLKRKDSSGVVLKDGTVPPLSSGTTKMRCLEPISLEPGMNKVIVESVAGPVGKYEIKRLAIRVSSLELVCCNLFANQPAFSFPVVQEPPQMTVSRANNTELFAGLEQIVKFSLFTGSSTTEKGTKIQVKCSRGLRGGLVENDSPRTLENEFHVLLPDAEPFKTIDVALALFCDLPVANLAMAPAGTKYRDLLQDQIEHKLLVSDPWSKEPSSSYRNLPLLFSTPFSAQMRLSTSFAKKFVEYRMSARRKDAADEAKSVVSNLMMVTQCLENQTHSFRFLRPDLKVSGRKKLQSRIEVQPISNCEEVFEVDPLRDCTFFYQLLFPDGDDIDEDEVLRLHFSVSYKRPSLPDDKGTAFSVQTDIKDFRTLYSLTCRVSPLKGGEVCRAGTICLLTIDLEHLANTKHNSIMYEVLADQSVWAVCGRAAAVVDMSTSKKVTLTVEVMPLVGGQLLMPKVRLSKYIPSAGQTRDSGSKLEPFLSEQIFNASRFSLVHVLSSSSSVNLNSNTGGTNSNSSSLLFNNSPIMAKMSGALSLP